MDSIAFCLCRMLASLSSGMPCSGNFRPSIMIPAELPIAVPRHCVHGTGQTGYLFSLILQSTRLGEVMAPKLLPSEHLSEILVTITAGRKAAFQSGATSWNNEGQEPPGAHGPFSLPIAIVSCCVEEDQRQQTRLRSTQKRVKMRMRGNKSLMT